MTFAVDWALKSNDLSTTFGVPQRLPEMAKATATLCGHGQQRGVVGTIPDNSFAERKYISFFFGDIAPLAELLDCP